jgi:hypothetical protein
MNLVEEHKVVKNIEKIQMLICPICENPTLEFLNDTTVRCMYWCCPFNTMTFTKDITED